MYFQGLRRCETVSQHRFDRRHLYAGPGDRAADFISGSGKADVKEMFSHMLSAVRRGDLNKLGSLTLIMREFGQEALWIGSVS